MINVIVNYIDLVDWLIKATRRLTGKSVKPVQVGPFEIRLRKSTPEAYEAMASDMRLLRVADLARILIQALLRLCEAELDAPPNGGPATRLGKPGVREGPPSVS